MITFDRNREVFASILLFYQSKGRFVLKPRFFPPDLFIEELIFFGLDRYRRVRMTTFSEGQTVIKNKASFTIN